MIAAWELLTPCIVAGSALGHPMPAVFQAISGPEIAKGNQAICPDIRSYAPSLPFYLGF